MQQAYLHRNNIFHNNIMLSPVYVTMKTYAKVTFWSFNELFRKNETCGLSKSQIMISNYLSPWSLKQKVLFYCNIRCNYLNDKATAIDKSRISLLCVILMLPILQINSKNILQIGRIWPIDLSYRLNSSTAHDVLFQIMEY